MNIRKVFKALLKKLIRKRSIFIVLLLIFSTNNLTAYLFGQAVYSYVNEYSTAREWPTEIIVYRNGPGNLSNVVEKINNIDGVKWFVYPGGGVYIFDAFNYNEMKYTLQIMWCNVSDPTFPHPKYLVEGRFFKNNYENAVIVETIGRRLFEHLGIFKEYEKSILNLSIFGFNVSLTFVGAVSSILIEGREDYYLRVSNTIFLYVPINVYYELYNETKILCVTTRKIVPGPQLMYVKVKDGYNINEVIKEIKNLDPTVGVASVNDAKENLEVEYTIALVIALILFGVASLVMIWDVVTDKEYISLLKVLGWTKWNVLALYILTYLIYGVLASSLGLLVNFLDNFLGAPPGPRLLNLLLTTFIPLHYSVGISTALIFSIPAIIKVYKVSAESLLRE
ncbi:MAG: hypothetical protein ACP6IS_08390 [Candidatus Asgardarchaeia archaeon]